MPRKLYNALLGKLLLAAGLGLGAAPGAWAQLPGPVASVPAPAAPTSSLLWLALALAALGVLGVAVLWNKLANTRRLLEETRHKYAAPPKSVGVEVFSQAKMTAAIAKEITKQLDQRVAARQAKAKAGAPPVATPPAPVLAAPVVSLAPVLEAPVAPPAPRMRTQYVGEAPFNNSFAARSLSDQPGPYSLFAIESSEQQPEQGTFAVTGNLASHVRDHRSVLEPVCEYVGGYPLGSETRVVTEQPGQVRRRGDDWEVTQRAKVRFE